MNQKVNQIVFAAVLALGLTSCASDVDKVEENSLPDVEQDVVDFLDDEQEDPFNDELDQNSTVNSKIDAPVDFKDWESTVEMSNLVMEKDGYTLELPADLVSCEWETANKLTLSQNIPVASSLYQSKSTNDNHWISIVRGDAGIVETKEMVYKQQLQLQQLAEEQQIPTEELVIIHDFKEFDNKFGETFQYTMIETMNFSEEFPTTLILILAQENGHLSFDASYENNEQKENLKTYLLELCYHISPENGTFSKEASRGVSTFYQQNEDGSREALEFTSGEWVSAREFTQ